MAEISTMRYMVRHKNDKRITGLRDSGTTITTLTRYERDDIPAKRVSFEFVQWRCSIRAWISRGRRLSCRSAAFEIQRASACLI